MKWIGQHIYDLVSRFRNDVYLESISTGTIASGGNLGLDSNNKIVKADEATGDITSITLTAGTGVDLTSISGATSGAYEATIGVDVSDFMSSGVDNRVLTATGTDAMQAEEYFTFQNTGNISRISLLSNQDTGDKCTIDTTTHGATTITTNDDDAAAAHFEIAADGNITLDAAGDIYNEADAVYFTSTSSNNPIINIKNFVDDANGARLRFTKDKGGAGADGDDIGTIEFVSDDTAQTLTHFGSIIAEVSEADDSDEAGKLTFKVAASDGTTTGLQPGLILEGEHATSGEVDVTIANGEASTTTVAGNLTVAGTVIESPGRLRLNPAAGNDILLDGTISVDAGVVTGASSITSTAFVGTLSTASQPNVTTLAGVSAIGSAGTPITITSDTVEFTSANSDDPLIKILNTTDNDQGARLFLWKARTDGTIQGGEADDEIGALYFYGYDSASNLQGYGKIETFIDVATHGQESGIMQLGVASHDGGFNNGLYMKGGSVDTEVDVTIGTGTASVTTVAGDLSVTTGLILDSVDVTTIQTGSESFADNDTSLMTSAAVNDRINRPSGQMFMKNFNFSVNAGTTEYYFPFASTAESTSSVNQAVTMIMPTAGKLIKIHLRTSVDHSGQTTTFTLYNWDTNENWNNGNKSVLGVQSGTGPGIGEVVTYDFTSSLDSGTNAFTANEMIALSFQNGGDPGANTKYVATIVFELDWTSY